MDKSDLILEKLNCMDADIKRMDTNIKRIDTNMQRMETDIKNMCADIKRMDTDIKRMDTDIKRMDTDIRNIKLILENEVRPNIMRVAEGHLDLSRSFNEIKKTNNDFEMLTVKVNVLETDVRELKRKIS